MRSRLERVGKLLDGAATDGSIPGSVVVVSRGTEVVFRGAYGTKLPIEGEETTPAPAMDAEAVFDVGPLTAAVVTTSLLMRFCQSSKFSINDRISRFVQGFGVGVKTTTTIGHLLSQASGLPAQASLYDELNRLNSGPRLGILASKGAKQYVYDQVLQYPLRSSPGEKQQFSELNFIILGQLCELLSGLPLDRAFQKFVATPLALRSTSFIDLGLMKRRGYQTVSEVFASHGVCAKRDRIICGETYDLTAWAMGGVAGHSGLFSTADDIATWCREILAVAHGASGWLRPETLSTFWSFPSHITSPGWVAGWEIPSKENGLNDSGLPARWRGFMANSTNALWIDPATGLSLVLLTNVPNPLHPSRKALAVRNEVISEIGSAAGVRGE
jgi:CubicO group peptidase (beta-lactamase class C family)